MKNLMLLLLAGCMPLVVVAGTATEGFGRIDAGTIAALLIGCTALVLARRMQKP